MAELPGGIVRPERQPGRSRQRWELATTFTLDEAQMLLPVVSVLLERAREAAMRAGEAEQRMQELSQRIFLSGGLHVDVVAAARWRAEREKAVDEARKTLEEITEIGVRVAENEGSVLEFPFLLEGRTVLLCWTLGDEAITEWREENDKPEVRRPVDSRFGGKRERERPN